jgi:hypothetical protein
MQSSFAEAHDNKRDLGARSLGVKPAKSYSPPSMTVKKWVIVWNGMTTN